MHTPPTERPHPRGRAAAAGLRVRPPPAGRRRRMRRVPRAARPAPARHRLHPATPRRACRSCPRRWRTSADRWKSATGPSSSRASGMTSATCAFTPVPVGRGVVTPARSRRLHRRARHRSSARDATGPASAPGGGPSPTSSPTSSSSGAGPPGQPSPCVSARAPILSNSKPTWQPMPCSLGDRGRDTEGRQTSVQRQLLGPLSALGESDRPWHGSARCWPGRAGSWAQDRSAPGARAADRAAADGRP